MKLVIPWILSAALAVALAWQFTVAQRQKTELASARLAGEQLEALQQEFETKQQEYAGIAEEAQRLRDESKDLLRLRNEVVQLRKDKAQLSGQVQTVRSQAQNAQEQAALAQQQAEALRANAAQSAAVSAQTEAQARFLKRYGLQATPEQAVGPCVNNLRQIEGAKQQWALENSKPGGSAVDVAALAPYLNNQVPACPAGGSYTLGTVGAHPTCSIPGHAVPTEPK